jgi:hypothetical protein
LSHSWSPYDLILGLLQAAFRRRTEDKNQVKDGPFTLTGVGLLEYGQTQWVTNVTCLYPTYIRGQAYLAAGQGAEAAAEFQKILDHSGLVWNCWTGALETKTTQGADADAARVRALAVYKDFLALWKGADPGIPI